MAIVMIVECPDCSTFNYIQMTTLYKKRTTGEYGLMLLARCRRCFQRGDKNSIRATSDLTAHEFNAMVDGGLICLAID